MKNNNLVCLVCTISEDDFDNHPESFFLTNYFSLKMNTRTKPFHKAISIVPRNAVDSVIQAYESKLLELGICKYSFNFSTDYLMEDI